MPRPRGIVGGTGGALERRPGSEKGVVAMYARTTTVNVRPSMVEEAIGIMREEVMHPVLALDGNIGLSMLADRASGRCIVTSAWTDREAMRASAAQVAPLRDRMSALASEPMRIQEWEVAVVHRHKVTGDGACARVTWLEGAAADAERGIEVYRSQVVPALDEIPGFCSASLLLERESGRSVSTVAYESRAMLEASRPDTDQLRARASQQSQARIVEVAEFELVLSHLRVPEKV